VLATIVALLAMPAAALAAGGPTVTVRVQGLTRALLLPKAVHTHGGWVTRYGAPRGACPARSAQGALNAATRRRWRGVWTTQFGPEYEITSILGETHSFSSKYFWEIFADNVAATAGACELKLHRGEQLLFAAVPQTGNAYPSALRAPQSVAAGHAFSVKVVWFNARGRAKPLAGARVTGGGLSATTNGSGVATLIAAHAGTLVLHAHHKRSASTVYVRAVPVTVHVS
jgi:hypothetical protein